MTCCALCGDIRKFHEIDREELEAMIFDFGQSIATMKVNVHARQPHRFVYVDLERLERDLRAIRDRVIIDGEEFFEPEVPF